MGRMHGGRQALLAACGVVALAAACSTTGGHAPSPAASPAPMDLVVLHTNDDWGETQPCG